MATDESISTLEKDFPHIARRLTGFWNTDGFYPFMIGLALTDRPDRQGFPENAAKELMFLQEIHDLLYARKMPSWAHS